jgi:hypothetical protein
MKTYNLLQRLLKAARARHQSIEPCRDINGQVKDWYACMDEFQGLAMLYYNNLETKSTHIVKISL